MAQEAPRSPKRAQRTLQEGPGGLRTEMALSRGVEARGKAPEEIQRVCSSRAKLPKAPRKRHEVTKALRRGP
eukprot:110333-Pyramimonas_sp.AAC.1